MKKEKQKSNYIVTFYFNRNKRHMNIEVQSFNQVEALKEAYDKIEKSKQGIHFVTKKAFKEELNFETCDFNVDIKNITKIPVSKF